MGICLTSRKSGYSFNLSYNAFYMLRANICYVFDKELGKAYSNVFLSINNPEEYDQKIKQILTDERFKDEDIDIINFFFDSDREGKCGYKTCKKLYDLIKDVNFIDTKYLDKNDYDEIKLFLKECYQKRRMMIWSSLC